MAFNVNPSAGVQRAAINPPAPSGAVGTSGATNPPVGSPGARDSAVRVGGERRSGLDMGGTQPTHHAMLVPKSQFQTPKAANDNARNHGTPEEKAQGLHVDEFGWVTLPAGSTITMPPKT